MRMKARDSWLPGHLLQQLVAAWLKHTVFQVLQALSQHWHAHASREVAAHDIALSALVPST